MNKNKDKIFIVIEYGGQYEDSYEHVICAFDDYGSAKEYTDKMKKMYSSVNEDTFNEIERVLSIEEDKINAKYFGDDVIKKPNIGDYENEINKFHEKTKFEIVENMSSYIIIINSTNSETKIYYSNFLNKNNLSNTQTFLDEFKKSFRKN